MSFLQKLREGIEKSKDVIQHLRANYSRDTHCPLYIYKDWNVLQDPCDKNHLSQAVAFGRGMQSMYRQNGREINILLPVIICQESLLTRLIWKLEDKGTASHNSHPSVLGCLVGGMVRGIEDLEKWMRILCTKGLIIRVIKTCWITVTPSRRNRLKQMKKIQWSQVGNKVGGRGHWQSISGSAQVKCPRETRWHQKAWVKFQI